MTERYRVLVTDEIDPEGVALLRAYIRTVNTYFAADYKRDERYVTYLANLLKTDAAILRSATRSPSACRAAHISDPR